MATAQIRNVLRGLAVSMDASPAGNLGALDRALARLEVGTMATAVLCQTSTQPAEGAAGVVVRWSNAGHPPPLLRHPDGTAEFLEPAPELLLGVAPAEPRFDHEVSSAPGATLLLYTDGLVEHRGSDLDAGTARLRRLVGELGDRSPDEFCDALLERLAAGSEDDVALLALRVRP